MIFRDVFSHTRTFHGFSHNRQISFESSDAGKTKVAGLVMKGRIALLNLQYSIVKGYILHFAPYGRDFLN